MDFGVGYGVGDHDNVASSDGLVWDELSHEQSREMQQHQFRVRRSHTTWSMVKGVAKQTASVVSSLASAAASKASNLTSTYYHSVPSSNSEASQNLHEFGLSTYHHNHAAGQQDDDEEGRRDPLLGGDPSDYGYHSPSRRQQQQNTSSSPRSRRDSFVFLKNFSLLPKRDGWGAVANLDLFFSSIYNYYYHGGLYPILGKGLVELISLFFTLWLSVFLFAYLDWKALATCTDETTCHADFHSYIIDKPFRRASLWNLLVILYCLLFIAYGVFAVWSFLQTVRNAWESKYFFEEKLGISSLKLEGGAVDWDRDVVAKLMELQQTGQYRIAISGQGSLDALVVAQRILRRENYMVAFFNCMLLDLTVPFMRGTYFCKSLEWSLYFCVLNYMFNHKYQIRPAFYLDPPSLRRRFILCGIAHAVFMPFLLFFMTLHFSMQNVYEWKSTSQYLGPREWSLSAKWTMREFNELPHFYERRLGPSYGAAENYLKLFTQNSIITAVGRTVVFVGGSLCAVLIVLGAINDSIILHVKLGDWNLLWYLGILGVVFTTGKSMLPDPAIHPKYTRNLFAEMEAALAQVTTHTHHYPDTWKGRGWKRQTYKEFSALFQYKARLFVLEVVSVIMAPLVLCISLPKCAEHICEFVLTTKTEVPGAGDVCGFSTFDFDAFQDDNWEGRTMGTAAQDAAAGGESSHPLSGSVMASAYLTQSVEAARALHPTPKAKQGKMEKSFFTFKASHPSWKCSQSGQDLVDQVAQYQYNETLALARERQLHIEAAARQLETLSQLEKKRLAESTHSAQQGIRQVDSTYIGQQSTRPDTGSGADSGGGGTVPLAPTKGNATADTPPTAPIPGHAVPPAPAEAPSRVHFEDSKLPRSETATPPPFAASEQASAALPLPTNTSVPPPRRLIPPNAPSPGTNPTAPAASVLHYADVGLSTELRRILNRSTLEADISAAGSVLGGGYDPAGTLASVLTNKSEDVDRNAERQYLWLERYHSYLAEQQRSQQNRTESIAEERSTLSASDGMLSRGDSSRRTGGTLGAGGMSSMV